MQRRTRRTRQLLHKTPLLLLAVLLGLASFADAVAADGDLDPGFGSGGKITTAIGSSEDGGYAVAVQSDGKIVVAGYTQVGGTRDFALARYISDGGAPTPTPTPSGPIPTPTPAQGNIITVAGNGAAGYSGDGGPAINASLVGPQGVAVDGDGNLYIADTDNHRIRKVDAAGNITTVAGNGTAGYSGDGGSAINAKLNFPLGLAVDGTGNLYIADSYNNRIRKVDSSGVISTIAGNGSQNHSGDGGAATNAGLYRPVDVALDGAGNIYIAAYWNHRIRKVDSAGIITTVAGNGTQGYGGDGGAATGASLNRPDSIVLDGNGNLYISDQYNHRIRKVDSNGVITTVAGNGTAAFSGDGGTATSASLNLPFSVVLDGNGNLYISDQYNHRIRKVDGSGVITTVAGNGTAGFGGDGGPATSASLNLPAGLTVDGAGNLYLADVGNKRVRKVEGVSLPTATPTPTPSGPTATPTPSGPTPTATFSGPTATPTSSGPTPTPAPCTTKTNVIAQLQSNSALQHANPVYASAGQSFTLPAGVTSADGITAYFSFVAANATITLNLYNGPATGNIGTPIATATYTNPGGIQSNAEVFFRFDTPVSVTPGNVYYFLMSPSYNPTNFGVLIATNDPYSGGTYLSGGSNGTVSSSPFPGYDLKFSVFQCDNTGPTATPTSGAPTPTPTPTPSGPTPTPTPSAAPPTATSKWSGLGPEGGPVNELALVPSASGAIYAATQNNGVFKSADGGATWTAMNNGLSSPTVYALAVNPQITTTVYAGASSGVFKSTDGGASWSEANTGLSNNRQINALAMDPTAPDTLYAGAWSGGIFKTTDGGANWSQVLQSNDQNWGIVVNPTTPSTIYAAMWGSSGGVLKSTDGGATWNPVNNGLGNTSAKALVIHPTQPNTLYVSLNGKGIYKTTDGGANWTEINTGLGVLAKYATALAIDPQNPDTLYLGAPDDGLYKTTDGGASWTKVNNSLSHFGVDFNHLLVDPDASTTVYGGFDNGFQKSLDNGATWTATNSGLTNVQVTDLKFHPTISTTLYIGTSGNGLFKSENGGATWEDINNGLTSIVSNDFYIPAVVIDPATPTTLYAATSGHGIIKSTDGGANWTLASTGLGFNPFVQSLVIDPKTPSTLYLGANNGVYKSTDSGGNWTLTSTGLPSNSWVYELAIDPNTPTTLYAGTTKGVYKSTDSGGSWTAMNNGLLAATTIYALRIDPTNPSTLYVGYYAGVYKSTDGGANWTAANSGMNAAVIYSLAIDPSNSNILYAGSYGKGIFKSTDGGATWNVVNDGLTNSYVNVLATAPDASDILYAGTWGGVFIGRPQAGPPLPEDGNGDGIPDSQQPNVETLRSETGNAVTLAAPAGVTLQNVKAMTPTVPPPANVGLPQGLIGFDAQGVSAGGSLTMTLILQQGATATSYWKYGKTPDNQTDHWYEFLYDATTKTGAIINGRQITLYFVDGQRGDGDLAANGVISDPGGPGGVVLSQFLYLPQVAR